ncbi:MAG: dienelactone hydrolase family protein [Dehalococcoidia bacterium]
MAGRWDTLTVDGAEMRCYVTTPSGSGPHPAVVVIQHAGGVDDFVQTMTDRIAEAGFVGAAPDLYHRDDPNASDDALTRMSRLRDKHIVADTNATIAHVKGMSEVRSDRLGITGFCMGGRVAYLMAAQAPELKASVVFYGGNTMVSWGEGAAPFELSDRIACPVLGLFGEDDGNPNPADVAKIDAELTRLGKTHEFHSYAGAGHAFMSEGRPSHRAEAAADAWQKCVAWFDRYLKD